MTIKSRQNHGLTIWRHWKINNSRQFGEKIRILTATEPAVTLSFFPHWYSLAKMQYIYEITKSAWTWIENVPGKACYFWMNSRIRRFYKNTCIVFLSFISHALPPSNLLAMLAKASMQWKCVEAKTPREWKLWQLVFCHWGNVLGFLFVLFYLFILKFIMTVFLMCLCHIHLMYLLTYWDLDLLFYFLSFVISSIFVSIYWLLWIVLP